MNVSPSRQTLKKAELSYELALQPILSSWRGTGSDDLMPHARFRVPEAAFSGLW